jgi:hypothetical protein
MSVKYVKTTVVDCGDALDEFDGGAVEELINSVKTLAVQS